MVGQYLNSLIVNNNMEGFAFPAELPCGFTLNHKLANTSFGAGYKSPEGWFFGQTVLVAGLRGVSGAVSSGLKGHAKGLKQYLKKVLKESCDPFCNTMYFIRNFWSHNITNDFTLRKKDIHKFIMAEKDCDLKFKYSSIDAFKEHWHTGDYGIDSNIDFKKVKEGDKLTDHVSELNMYKLSELCWNLSELFLNYPTSKL